MDSNTREAIKLLGIYTANRFDIWALAGNSKASCRQHVMSTLLGRKVPRKDCGVHAMREQFNSRCQITGDCIAVRETNFINLARSIAA